MTIMHSQAIGMLAIDAFAVFMHVGLHLSAVLMPALWPYALLLLHAICLHGCSYLRLLTCDGPWLY